MRKVRREPQTEALGHDKLLPLLHAMFREFQELSKKKPDSVLNKKKIEIANKLLKDVLSHLEGTPFRQYLYLLDEDDLPQNSDVMLILGQAIAAMRNAR